MPFYVIVRLSCGGEVLALRLSGFTRASSLGPIAEFLNRQGGSAARVLRDVDLPFALLDQPELVIPLREQFRFLERAARRTGDPFFGARLGQVVRAPRLSAYGAWVCDAATLMEAVRRAHAGLNAMLQTSTVLAFETRAGVARWSIEFLDPETEGRRHNELLGVGYMTDVVRCYAGRRWAPDVVMTPLPAGTPRAGLEEIFRANVVHGRRVATIEFDAALLGAQRRIDVEPPSAARLGARDEPPVPGQNDILARICAVADLALHQGYPRLDWVAAKLDVSPRTLQRLLGVHDVSFNGLVAGVLLRRAKVLLDDRAVPITEIALALGYRDHAHFTRAFRRWTGVSPSAYREADRRFPS